MIKGKETIVIQRSGDFVEKEFEIAHTAEMFDILSDSLYSDAQSAVLRELGTNAVDAHVEANIPTKPFSVKFPSVYSPQLVIRDFGLGLSKEKVYNVYTTYGLSDKTSSNAYTGMLGLGSKSPFALNSDFTVVSYHQGVKTTYSLFKNEFNKPAIAELASEPTTEQGLEIIIPIKGADSYSWEQKARLIYQWFKVRPTTGGRALTYEPVTAKWDKPTWKLGHTLSSAFPNAICLMGNIAYPIEKNNFDAKYHPILTNKLIIDTNIGDVNFSASREKLQYTKKTKDFIVKKLDEITDILSKESQTVLDKCTSLYQATVVAKGLYLAKIIDSFRWKGQPISTNRNSIQLDYNFYKEQDKTEILERSYGNKFFHTSGIAIIERVKFYLADERGSQGIVNHNEPYGNGQSCYLIPNDRKVIDRFVKDVGINESDIILCSTLPKPPVAQRTVRSVSEKVLKYNKSHVPNRWGRTTENSWWDGASVKSTDKVFYFPVKRYKPVINGKEVDPEQLRDIIKWLETNGVTPVGTEYYGVRSSMGQKYKKDWTNLDEKLKSKFDELWVSQKYDELLSLNAVYNDLISSYESSFREFLKTNTTFGKPDVKKIVEKWQKVIEVGKEPPEKIAMIEKLKNVYGKSYTPHTLTKNDFVTDKDYIKKTYAVLQFIGERNWSEKEVVTVVQKSY